jgi:predicted anti-sigma-YlaC factor YlaD
MRVRQGLSSDRAAPSSVYNRRVARPLRIAVALLAALAPLLLAGCSIKKLAINKLGDAMAESGATYARDDDPDLIRDAVPFALKLTESLLDQSPRHRGLLTSAASGFTQYAYAFVHEEADETEDRDPNAAAALRLRARRLYLRARGYGLRGLEVAHPGFEAALRKDPASALDGAVASDVPLLYWTAASWGGAISLSKDVPDMVADLSLVGELMRRALALDEGYDSGALHEFMISYEGARSDAMGGSMTRAREHFDRAVKLSGGGRAAPFLDLAETVSVRNQDRAEFVALLHRALAIDPDARPDWRLVNLVLQRRARWLLARADLLFAE